ncbi:putative flagellar hook formation protein FlgD [Sodalis glossinidius str. 'morsitans']|uniref:Basal-body rod modification protein FlgD n=1 Tax=Sodalis glossinidius (strain morsitans) TaxID=343509 RepID=Q2NR91_SODGM|nr:putative flagellar hook formation protein FlgD [Sodalis glossinidius str. 'morsitans']
MSLAVNLNETASSASAASTTSSSGSESSADLQNNFLTLLVAQLRNQDPTNPLDNAELTTQLAQISILSSIENLNTMLGSISSQNLQATTLVGHGVMVDGSGAVYYSRNGEFSLNADRHGGADHPQKGCPPVLLPPARW